MRIIAGQHAADRTAPACAGMPIDLFFPRDGERAESWEPREAEALALCAACPIREQCLNDALRFPATEQHGVAGGLTSEQRRAEIRNRRRREARRSERAA
jgi:WhiB family transcriptional regulator, redox-sensing transcriptional regulator